MFLLTVIVSVWMIFSSLPSDLQADGVLMEPQPSSMVTVEVQTNVNRLVYRSSTLEGAVIRQLWRTDSGAVFDSVWIRIPSTSLTSGNRKMDRDLQALIKPQENPWISIRLHGFSVDEKSGMAATSGWLRLAGVENKVQIPLFICFESSKTVTISGENPIDLRDYSLEPPRVMGGLVRINPTVNIRFALEFSTHLTSSISSSYKSK